MPIKSEAVKRREDRRCSVCKGPIDWDVIREEFGSMLSQVDYYGVESLTEWEQAVYEGHICSYNCYEANQLLSIRLYTITVE